MPSSMDRKPADQPSNPSPAVAEHPHQACATIYERFNLLITAQDARIRALEAQATTSRLQNDALEKQIAGSRAEIAKLQRHRLVHAQPIERITDTLLSLTEQIKGIWRLVEETRSTDARAMSRDEIILVRGSVSSEEAMPPLTSEISMETSTPSPVSELLMIREQFLREQRESAEQHQRDEDGQKTLEKKEESISTKTTSLGMAQPLEKQPENAVSSVSSQIISKQKNLEAVATAPSAAPTISIPIPIPIHLQTPQFGTKNPFAPAHQGLSFGELWQEGALQIHGKSKHENTIPAQAPWRKSHARELAQTPSTGNVEAGMKRKNEDSQEMEVEAKRQKVDEDPWQLRGDSGMLGE